MVCFVNFLNKVDKYVLKLQKCLLIKYYALETIREKIDRVVFLFLFCFVFHFVHFFLIFRGPSLGEYLKNSRNMKRVIDPGELSTFIS